MKAHLWILPFLISSLSWIIAVALWEFKLLLLALAFVFIAVILIGVTIVVAEKQK
jgi:hypothetical protein